MTTQKLKFTVNPTRLTILLLAASLDRQEADNALELMRTLPFIHLELKQYFDEEVDTSLAQLPVEIVDLVYKSINIMQVASCDEFFNHVIYDREMELEIYSHVIATLLSNHGFFNVNKGRILTDELDKLFVQTVTKIVERSMLTDEISNENLIIAMGSLWTEVGLIIGEKLLSICDISKSQNKEEQTVSSTTADPEDDEVFDAQRIADFNRRFNETVKSNPDGSLGVKSS